MNVIPSRVASSVTPSKAAKAEERSGINLYEKSPNMELSLDEFEIYALKRLKVGWSEAKVDIVSSTVTSLTANLISYHFATKRNSLMLGLSF